MKTAKLTLKNTTLTKYTGVQFRVFYDKVAFVNASVALLGTTTNLDMQQVVDAIMQGANPEDLLKMGVPQELIDQAMMILMEQTQPQGQEGLAGMQVTQNDRPMRM